MRKYSILNVTLTILVLIVFTFSVKPAKAAAFEAGDADSLIAAINAANDEATNPGPDTIDLTADVILTNTLDENAPLGETGLPAITSDITILGNHWSIERLPDTRPQFRIFEVDASGTLALRDVTVSGAFNESEGNCSPRPCGGGLFNYGGNVSITNSTFSGNYAVVGGGLYNEYGGTMTISDSLITDNSAILGGGIMNLGTLNVDNTLISHNSAYGIGAGIDNAGILQLTNSTISDNTVGQDGAGIYNQNSDFMNSQATITGSSIVNNLAGTITGFGAGGGIYNFENSTMTISDSTIAQNSTVSLAEGGGIVNVGTMSLSDVTLQANSTDSDDDSGEGGGVLNYGNLTITDSYLTQNMTDGSGSALQNTQDTASVSVHNSCIAGNRRDVTSVINTGSALLDASGNWWGSNTGPSGAAPGGGDSVSANVNYSGYVSTQLAHCIGAPQLRSPDNGHLTVSQPLLLWNAVPGATQYQIDFNGTVTTRSLPNYTPPTSLQLGTYRWRVRAGTATQWSNWSEQRFIVLDSPPNAAPTLNYYRLDTPSITLTWNRVSWATSYELEVHKNASFTDDPVHIAIVSSTYDTLIPTNLGDGVYYWRVRAKNDVTTGLWSSTQDFTIDSSS